MKKKHSSLFTPRELALGISSCVLIITSFLIFDRSNYLTLTASLIGVISLLFLAKGNPIGQLLMIIFSILYGIISYTTGYYGEMLTYLGMTAPMALFALISWLRNPYGEGHSTVKISKLRRGEWRIIAVLAVIITAIFYFLLGALGTANLTPSTISVTTSFLAVYLTLRRSAYYALFYALNDIVLILLWGLACINDPTYISVIICFVAFLAGDIYGFINWRKMYNIQAQKEMPEDN